MRRGRLIAIEGLYGSGKTTLRNCLEQWLVATATDYVTSEWNSSPIASRVLTLRKNRKLDGQALLLLELADLALRFFETIRPALDRGAICIVDRYVYSAMTRALVRLVDESWVHQVAAFAPRPDVVFFMDTPIKVCLARRAIPEREWSGYVSGEDFLPSTLEPECRFAKYQEMLLSAYKQLFDSRFWIRVDGLSNPEVILATVIHHIRHLINTRVG